MPQRRKLTHPLLLAVPWVAFYVSVFGLLYGAYQIVYLRVELGTRQQRSIDALEANPASFVWYTLDLPAKQLPATPEGDDAAAIGDPTPADAPVPSTAGTLGWRPGPCLLEDHGVLAARGGLAAAGTLPKI